METTTSNSTVLRGANHLGRLAEHFDSRADRYFEKYTARTPRHLYEHEKRVRADLACRWLHDYARQCPNGHLLDVGCGDGRIICRALAQQPTWRATGVDLSANMVHRARQAASRAGIAERADWLVESADQVTGQYDAVVALGVVGYQLDQAAFLETLANCVAPGGALILTFANGHSFPRRLREMAQRINQFRVRNRRRVRFRPLTTFQLDCCLQGRGFCQTALQWLCFGFGMRHSNQEIRLSQWLERRWGRALLAEYVAQVGVVCFRRFGQAQAA